LGKREQTKEGNIFPTCRKKKDIITAVNKKREGSEVEFTRKDNERLATFVDKSRRKGRGKAIGAPPKKSCLHKIEFKD